MTRLENVILLIDDDPAHAKAFEQALIDSEDDISNFQWVRTLASGIETLARKKAWAIFLHFSLPDSHGIETLDRLLSIVSHIPVIVLGVSRGRRPLQNRLVARGAGLSSGSPSGQLFNQPVDPQQLSNA